VIFLGAATSTTLSLNSNEALIRKNDGVTSLGTSVNSLFTPSDANCPLLEYQAFSDSAGTILWSDTAVSVLNPTSLNSAQLQIDQQTGFKKTLFLFGYTTAGGPVRASLNLTIVVCGNEQLALSNSSLLTTVVNTTLLSLDYTSWFQVTFGPTTHPYCTISSYFIADCSNSASKKTNPSTELISMPESASLVSLTASTDTYYYFVCLYAETFGKVQLKRDLLFTRGCQY